MTSKSGFKKSPKLTIFHFLAFLMNFLSTQNVNVARFARNVEWDFFRDFPTFPTLNQWRLKSIEIPYWIDSLSLVDIYCLQIVEKRGGAAIYTDFNNGGLLEWIMRRRTAEENHNWLSFFASFLVFWCGFDCKMSHFK